MTWRHTSVAPDRTHHLVDGTPAYARRFREVLKFHDPGLAPALDEDGATHIDVAGRPAYAARFLRTFGFYEGRAAVQANGGWLHVLPDGSPLYDMRYGWCGNYQGGRCAVRDPRGGYLHLLPDGGPAYGQRWRYAGDYRDGLAVVQRDDGLHSHVDLSGAFTHGRWFVDLDVFHKGFARARDRAGWTHVDADGAPQYERRFANVEPFYNGQARVERADGALEIIDEEGRTLAALRPSRRSAFASLSADLVGFWRTQAIAAAVQLGLPEALPQTTGGLALALGLHEERLGALLRGLRELDLVARSGEVWSLSARGALLRRDHPLTLADAALEYAGPLGALWDLLPRALRDEGWSSPDVFGHVAAEPARVGPHHRMLQSYARHDYPAVAAALPLAGDETVVDAGGGTGALARLLVEHHPSLRVKILERAEVARLVPPHPRIEAAAGDLFAPWGIAADAAILARVLHDWDEDRAVRILQNAAAALRPGAKVYVIEMLVSDDGAFGGLCDLHLLMATGGRERTADEYRRLLGRAGIELREVIPLAALPAILVGVVR